MPTNTESLNRELFRLLSKYKPKPLDAEGKVTPVPEEADVFKFEFTKDGEEYGTVYVTLDDERVLTVYFGDDVSGSPGDKTPGLDYNDTWSGLLHQLSSWRMTKGLRGFKTQNKDRVSDDMARRNHMRNKDKIAEGYYATGKKSSYSDAVPSVKIVIEHSRVIEEGEQRYRNINRIFLENQAGERYLLDTKKPGIARVYARHIAEGGKVNDDRWSHIGNLCEEYQKMAGFVRATRNGQFNESAQSLVNEGIEHYASLRESLSRMTGKRGYNSYFESWTPSLMEDGTEENNLNELFVQETLDPRIESVMPILNRIHKKVSESIVDKEMNKLAEWADSLVEEESRTSNNSGGIPEEVDLGQYDAVKPISNSGTTPEQEKEFRKKVQAYGKELDQRQKEKEKGVAENTGREMTNTPRDRLISRMSPSVDNDVLLQKVGKVVNSPEFNSDAILKIVDAGNTMKHPVGRYIQKEFDELQYDLGRAYEDHPEEVAEKLLAMLIDRTQQGMAEGSHEDQVARLAAYNERMAGENPPIDLGLREVGNWAKDGHHGDPIKTAWLNIAKYGVRNNRFKNSVDQVMSAIGEFPDLEDEVYDMYDINQDEVDALSLAYETVYDQYDQLQGQQGMSEDLDEDRYDDMLDDMLKAGGKRLLAKHSKEVQRHNDINSGKALKQHIKKNPGVLNTYSAAVKKEKEVDEGLDANQKRVGQLGPTEKVKNNNIGKLVGANENFINSTSQAVTTEDDEMAEGILDNIKNMFKPKDPTPVTPITADDIAKGYQTQPEFKAQVDQIAKQQGISPQELIKQLQQQAGGGVAQNATVPTQAFHEGLLDTLKKGVQGVKKFGQVAKAAGKEAWDEVVPQLKQDWKHPIQAALAKEGEMDEGEHTQHAMRGRNPGANEFEHDFEPEDKIGNIHDKISKMLKRLEKPKDKEPNMKDTDLGNTLHEAAPWEDEDEEDKNKKPKDTKGSDGADHDGHSRAKHLAKNAIPKDEKKEVNESEERPYICVHAKKGKCEVKASSSYQAAQKAAQKWGLKGTAGIDAHLADVKKDTSSLEESTDELARILTIMNHRR